MLIVGAVGKIFLLLIEACSALQFVKAGFGIVLGWIHLSEVLTSLAILDEV